MITYVVSITGSNPPVKSRVLLGSSIMITVGFALGAGFGICGFASVSCNQLSQMCFFILFGIGVDDMFIILEKFRDEPADHRINDTKDGENQPTGAS